MPRKPPVIAVVDDDEDVRYSLDALFRSGGLEVVCFADALSLLSCGDIEQFSCLVSDVQMPEMSGIELLGELRQRRVEIPTVVISAFVTEAVRLQASRFGAYSVLEKPFEPDDLFATVCAAGGVDPETI
ncbi:response regulator transcription factor [Chenggangzhangella methanolivorans]|uniref:Response regulator n=1 Tax=Chenggangzhangella methanolivorans TaxID=1437009 RepID=A0A9E6RE26_9HYPH|nr:response regulator [Chenggangzhangella methanolivorans]QZO01693.1 response regulator [Chenggangzhangella methanolivorans]